MIYIASSLHNRERVQRLRDRFLQEHNITLTFDWTIYGQLTDETELIEISRQEALGVVKAKCVLAVLPARSGSHFEMGLAFGLRKPIILLTDMPNCLPGETQSARHVSFHSRPEIMKYADENAAVAAVARIVQHGYHTTHLIDEWL